MSTSLSAIHGRHNLSTDGWVVITEELGHDPNNQHGADYGGLRQTPIVRLNNGYGRAGTIPLAQYYRDFARRVGNFAAASRGCSRWIIGNEPNHTQERPDGVPILPTQYADCFNQCRAEIHARPGHEQDQVLVAAVAPWNNQTSYSGNERGDWMRYFVDVQRGLAGCDGFALHTYATEQTPNAIPYEQKMGGDFADRLFGFQTFTQWMQHILPQYAALPCHITEFNINGVPWQNENTGVIQRAYQEIDRWNKNNKTTPILSLAVYRWQYDQWTFKDKPGVIADFLDAYGCGYVWPLPGTEPPGPEPPDPPAPAECQFSEAVVRRVVREEMAGLYSELREAMVEEIRQALNNTMWLAKVKE